MGIKETLLGLVITDKVESKWQSARNFGAGHMTHLIGAATVLSGLACLLGKIQGQSLSQVVANYTQLADSNCAQMISTGLGLIFLRRAISNVKPEAAPPAATSSQSGAGESDVEA